MLFHVKICSAVLFMCFNVDESSCMHKFLKFGEGALVLATVGCFPSREIWLLSSAITNAT